MLTQLVNLFLGFDPRMIDDGEGGQVEYTPPYKIVGFC
jgi:hypothetical protein